MREYHVLFYGKTLSVPPYGQVIGHGRETAVAGRAGGVIGFAFLESLDQERLADERAAHGYKISFAVADDLFHV